MQSQTHYIQQEFVMNLSGLRPQVPQQPVGPQHPQGELRPRGELPGEEPPTKAKVDFQFLLEHPHRLHQREAA